MTTKTRKTDTNAPAYIVSRYVDGLYLNDVGTYPTLEMAERIAADMSLKMFGKYSARVRTQP